MTATSRAIVSAAIVVIECFVGFWIPGRAEADPIDQTRYQAARSRAEQRWENAGYDKAPSSLDATNIAATRDQSLPAHLMDVLLRANSSNVQGTLAYGNDVLLPFIRTHKDHFLCLLTEDYYNSRIPTAEMLTFQESGMVVIYDSTYLLLGTEAERWEHRVVLPDDGWGEMMQSAIAVMRGRGPANPANKTNFNCMAAK